MRYQDAPLRATQVDLKKLEKAEAKLKACVVLAPHHEHSFRQYRYISIGQN